VISLLKAHVHEKKKPFKCDACSTSFQSNQDLRRHMVSIHEGKKPFKYDVCFSAFSQKYTLKAHVSSVHEGKCH
jgi:uncharacterized Zn-finger protein